MSEPGSSDLITRLSEEPVLGVSLKRVSVLRLDRLGGLASGNKQFKLSENLARAETLGVRRLVSFGGPWSNHLHALAATGRERGFETVGIVRGEAGPTDTAMLADAHDWGMNIVNVSRSEYRRRNDADYLRALEQQYAPCLVIPEGGSNADGAIGCLAIAEHLCNLCPEPARVVMAVGTGTTLAGVAAGLGPPCDVVGISALKGALDLEDRVQAAISACGNREPAPWTILHDYHCGGFARVNDDLREFILAFEQVQNIPLDPVYTAKAMFAIHHQLKSGAWDSETPTVMIHTGGLQGRRGFSFFDT